MAKMRDDRTTIRNKKVQIRLTQDEHSMFQAKAKIAGISVSDLIRNSAKKTRTWTAKDKKIQEEKVRHLARIGNNLNQIARWCNTYKADAEAVEVCQHLVAIEHEIKKALV